MVTNNKSKLKKMEIDFIKGFTVGKWESEIDTTECGEIKSNCFGNCLYDSGFDLEFVTRSNAGNCVVIVESVAR